MTVQRRRQRGNPGVLADRLAQTRHKITVFQSYSAEGDSTSGNVMFGHHVWPRFVYRDSFVGTVLWVFMVYSWDFYRYRSLNNWWNARIIMGSVTATLNHKTVLYFSFNLARVLIPLVFIEDISVYHNYWLLVWAFVTLQFANNRS